MPRRGIIKKKKLPGDQKYNSTLITKFINTFMKEGKRSTAERAVYATLDAIQQKTKEDPLKVFEKAVDNVRPVLETKSRRVGGATYQVPIEVESDPVDRGRRPLADPLRQGAGRPEHGRKAVLGDPGRGRQQGRRGQEARRYPQDGGSEPRFRSLPVVIL